MSKEPYKAEPDEPTEQTENPEIYPGYAPAPAAPTEDK